MKTALKNQDTTASQNTPALSPSGTNALAGSQSNKQIPVLDGVRAIACLTIVLLHITLISRYYNILPSSHNISNLQAILTYEYLSDYFGESGVILFFLLSSFLLFLPFAKALLFESPWPGLRRFYLRRIFRILPGYYVALLLMVLFFHPEFLHTSHWHDLWLFLTFRMDNGLSQHLNGPFWTLAVEFQFYLLLPIIAWLFSLLVRRGTVHWRMLKLSLCLLLMTAWGLLTRYWGLSLATTAKQDFLIPHAISMALKPYIYGDTGKYFEVFAVGMLVCMIYTYLQNAPSAESWRIRMHRLSSPLFAVGLVLLSFLSLWNFYNSYITSSSAGFHLTLKTSLDAYGSIVTAYWLQWQTLAYAVSYGFCLLALLHGSAKLKRPFEWPVLRWVASISFSLYIWHLPFLYLFVGAIVGTIQRQGWGSLVQYGAFWCWTLVVIVPVSAMFYRWIEQPGMRLGEWLIGKLEREQKNRSTLRILH